MIYEKPMRTDEVADYLGKSKKAVRRLAREGAIPGRKVGKEWYFNRRQIASLVGCGDALCAGPELDGDELCVEDAGR